MITTFPRILVRGLVPAIATVGVVGAAVPSSAAPRAGAPVSCQTTHAGDSDGDGRSDPVIGVPGKNRVVLFRGTVTGIVPTGSIEGSDVGLAMGVTGFAVAQGDVNGDHCADAAITDGGKVAIVLAERGSGLGAAGAQSIDDAAMGYPLSCDCVRFLAQPTFGDFNGDGYDDLAVVIRDVESEDQGELIHIAVVPGSPTGARPDETRFLAMDGHEIPFKSNGLYDPVLSLAAGDVNGDGRADLAVDIADETLGTTGQRPGPVDHGDVRTHPVVDVIYGSADGLGQGRATQVWDRESSGVPGGDDYRVAGSAVALGRFNHDRYADLAIAIPYEKAVIVIYGRADGLRAKGAAALALPGSFVDFPSRAAAADFDADHDDELVLSAANANKQQRVYVLRGTHHGLSANGLQVWTAHSSGIPRRQLSDGDTDDFGSVLRAGFYGRGAGEDLLISDDRDARNSGSVTELFGSPDHGLTTRHAVRFTEATKGIPGSPTGGENFGA